MKDSKIFWIGFNKIRGIGAVRLRQLLNHFGSLESAWNASYEELRMAGIGEKTAQSVVENRQTLRLEDELALIEKLGISVLTWDDEEYPKRLREIDQPPPVLFIKGKLEEQDDWAVSIVGTRQKTEYGRQVTEELSVFLAQNHITVISGLARGIDSIAHHSSLQAGGRTIAILGCGVDQIYPPEHRALAERIIQSGALISEYSLGTPPDGINFPPRNRLISGLSLATVVVEAGDTSGSLITATFAVNQGREVFALPGNIYSPKSRGTNRLIQNGARPLLDFEEILQVLDIQQVASKQQARQLLPSGALEIALFEVLSREPLHVDDIQAVTGLPVEQISATLVMMELKGLVRLIKPMTYVSIREDTVSYEVNQHD